MGGEIGLLLGNHKRRGASGLIAVDTGDASDGKDGAISLTVGSGNSGTGDVVTVAYCRRDRGG